MSSKEKHLALSSFLRRNIYHENGNRENLSCKKRFFGLKKDDLWTLVDKGYQAYFGEHNFVFVNDEKVKLFAVLQDGSEEIYKFTIIWMTILKKLLTKNFK